MKRILAAFLALFAAAVGAATLSPIQLLNPAGSTSGQAIVSTGAGTAPTWGAPVAGSLTAAAANTVIANTSGSTASPVASALPSCSTANSALQYTSGTGLACGSAFALTSGNLSQFAATTSAQFAGVLSDETGSGVLVFGTSPTLTTPNIVGTTTNNNANAGSVGEYIESAPAAVTLTTGTPTNCASLASLAAGDYDVTGNVYYLTGTGDSMSAGSAGINTVSATQATVPLFGQMSFPTAMPPGSAATITMPTRRMLLGSATTVYLVVSGNHSGGTLTAQCVIRARRVR